MYGQQITVQNKSKALHILLCHYEVVKHKPTLVNQKLPGLKKGFDYGTTVSSIAEIFRSIWDGLQTENDFITKVKNSSSPGELLYACLKQEKISEPDTSIFQQLIEGNCDNYKGFYFKLKYDVIEQKRKFTKNSENLKNLLYLEYVITQILPHPALTWGETLSQYKNQGGMLVGGAGLFALGCYLGKSEVLDNGEDGAIGNDSIPLVPIGLLFGGGALVINTIHGFFKSSPVPTEMSRKLDMNDLIELEESSHDSQLKLNN